MSAKTRNASVPFILYCVVAERQSREGLAILPLVMRVRFPPTQLKTPFAVIF